MGSIDFRTSGVVTHLIGKWDTYTNHILVIEYYRFGTCTLIIRSNAYFVISVRSKIKTCRVAMSPRRRIAASLLVREVGRAKRSRFAILGPHYARFVMIRVLFVKKIASELTPIDTNIKRRVQIRRICPFALFSNLIWIKNASFELSRITNRA